MAEASDRQLTQDTFVAPTSRSLADVRADIRETQARLSVGIGRTIERLDSLVTGPPPANRLPRESGLVGIAVGSITAFRNAREICERAWTNWVVRRVSFAAAIAGMAAVAAVSARRRKHR